MGCDILVIHEFSLVAYNTYFKMKQNRRHRLKLSECITQRKGYCFVKYEITSVYSISYKMYLLLRVMVIKDSGHIFINAYPVCLHGCLSSTYISQVPNQIHYLSLSKPPSLCIVNSHIIKLEVSNHLLLPFFFIPHNPSPSSPINSHS